MFAWIECRVDDTVLGLMSVHPWRCASNVQQNPKLTAWIGTVHESLDRFSFGSVSDGINAPYRTNLQTAFARSYSVAGLVESIWNDWVQTERNHSRTVLSSNSGCAAETRTNRPDNHQVSLYRIRIRGGMEAQNWPKSVAINRTVWDSKRWRMLRQHKKLWPKRKNRVWSKRFCVNRAVDILNTWCENLLTWSQLWKPIVFVAKRRGREDVRITSSSKWEPKLVTRNCLCQNRTVTPAEWNVE